MKKLTLFLLLFLIAWLAFALTPPVEVPPAYAQGWVNDPAAVAAARAGCEFARTEAFLQPLPGPEDVYLWEACQAVLGALPPARDQGPVGACVGFGTAAAVDHLQCVQIAAGEKAQYREASPEAIYAGSRVQVGGGMIRGDGSVGAWAAKYITHYGILPRAQYANFDLRQYDAALCRAWGRTGVPAELLPLTQKHPVKAAAAVRSWPELRAAVRNGYPVVVCSSQGFEMARDADGFCRPRGTWMHCLAAVGVCGGRRPGAFLLNSWGPRAHTGPTGRGQPSPAGFWADAAVIDRMTAQGDSWALSGFTGFPARAVNWYARD
jgi:hypothetical protein